MVENEFVTFVELIDAACRYPRMYTPMGSFYEIASFLEGCGSDRRFGNTNAHSYFTPFFKWIVERYRLKKMIGDWTDIRAQFETDEEAIRNFPSLYREYLNIGS